MHKKVLLYTAIFALVYQLHHISPALRGQCKRSKHATFAGLYPRHVRGLGAWLKPTLHYSYWEIGRELTCSRKLVLEILGSDAFLGHFIEFALWIAPLYGARGFALFQKRA